MRDRRNDRPRSAGRWSFTIQSPIENAPLTSASIATLNAIPGRSTKVRVSTPPVDSGGGWYAIE